MYKVLADRPVDDRESVEVVATNWLLTGGGGAAKFGGLVERSHC